MADELALPSDNEVSLAVAEDGVLVAGDRDAVERYAAQLQSYGIQLTDAGVTGQSLADVGAAGAALAALSATAGTYFQMAPESLRRYQDGGVLPSKSGYFKAILRNDRGHWDGNLDLREVSFGPEQAVSLQMAMATLALRSAIKNVEKAVERVEGKVDQLVVLEKAKLAGDIIGRHRDLAENVKRLERTGALPSVDWDTVASLGPSLTANVETLRQYLVGLVVSMDGAKDAHDRSGQLKQAVQTNRLGEVLQLLVVAEDSLYLWQRLRIERARTADAAHLEHIVDSARAQLTDDLKADGELVEALRRMLVEYSVLRPLEVHRRWSRASLERYLRALQGDLDQFVDARRIQIAAWPDINQPTLRDAREELRRRAVEAGHATKEVGSEVADFSAKQARKAQRAVTESVRKLGR